jgi:hypothetical protein
MQWSQHSVVPYGCLIYYEQLGVYIIYMLIYIGPHCR